MYILGQEIKVFICLAKLMKPLTYLAKVLKHYACVADFLSDMFFRLQMALWHQLYAYILQIQCSTVQLAIPFHPKVIHLCLNHCNLKLTTC